MKRVSAVTCLILICLLINVGGFSLRASVPEGRMAGKRSAPSVSRASLTESGDEARLAQFEQSLDALRQQYGIPGLSAAIVLNQQLVWSKGYGFQDIAGNIPATPGTPYRIASLTKTFASTLLMRCVEQQRVDLNTPIINYTLSITQPGVRIRHVFTHTSESVPPGESYRYNGNRYGALTPVIESCTGRPFREELAKTILDPLEMRDSVPGQDMEFPEPEVAALFTPETLQRYLGVIQRLAKPYRLDSSGRPILSAYPNRGINASAGLISTVRDLARYDAAIDRHQLLRPETQETAWTNPVNSRGQALPYANGWFAQYRFGTRLIWHYGLWPNSFSSLILKVPSRNITLILLANSDGLSAPFSALGGAGNVTGSPFANLFLQMLDDPEAFKGNPVDGEQFFVRQHYLDFLGREPDQGGLDYWSGQIAQCAGDAACIHARRIAVSAAFFIEQEFQETGNFVYRLYKSSLGRRPTFAEFMPDRSRLTGGAQLETSQQAFADEWVQRAEFVQKYPPSLSGAQFIDALLQTASQSSGVDVSGQRAALISDYEAYGSRARIVRMVAGNAALQQAQYNEAFVLMQYFGYLRRDPDEGGYRFWLDVLNNRVPNNFRSMVCAFLTSAEYQLRFGTVLTRTNSDCAQ